MKRVLLCTLIVIVLCSCAYCSDNEGKYVVLDVESEGSNRNEAIERGWVAGIREAVGSFIDSKVELNDDKLSERIIAYNRGLVERYEIIGVDDSRAAQGVYKIKMRLWILRDILRDGAAHISSGGAEITFSPDDVRKRIDELDAKALEARNASQETSKAKSQTAAELLSAMLNRYKPENFLTCYIPGKPEPVKDNPDMFTLKVEISFNSKLYKESFVPDLEQVLDQISAVKKNGLLVKKKNELRNIAANKPVKTSSTVIFEAGGLGDKYNIVVYNKPERFGFRLYGFRTEDKEKIAGALSEFIERGKRVAGILVELQDENRETLETVRSKFRLSYLLSGSGRRFAVHPSIIYGGNELTRFSVPVSLEMPEEILPYIKYFKASLILEESANFGLGITLKDNPSGGALVESVAKGSQAEKAGLKAGDVITHIDGKVVNNAAKAWEVIASLEEGYHAYFYVKGKGVRTVIIEEIIEEII